MLDRLTGDLQYQAQALTLRGERQNILAANIANADTPHYQGRDIDFAKALSDATAGTPGATVPGGSAAKVAPVRVAMTDSHHLTSSTGTLSTAAVYQLPEQASGDGNTVDMDRERANFADNALGYEATLRFINGNVQNILSAIKGE